MVAGAAKRALIFRMTGEESSANAAALADTARAAGLDVVIVPFWSDAAHEAAGGGPTILDGGFDFTPRLSQFAFFARHGFAPDLVELSAHSLAIDDARIENLMGESVWNQQLRGATDRAIGVLRAQAPDVVFVPHGAEVLSRLLAEACGRLSIPYLFWESAFFPGFHFMDPYAPHFFRGAHRIDRTWEAGVATPGAAERARAFMDRAAGERISKYRQVTSPEELAALKAWLAEREGPVLFVPGQIAFDASITVSLREYPDLGSIYRAVFHGVPPGWRIIFKPHPRGPDAGRAQGLPEHVRLVRQVSIHDLFALCDAVALHSSNVGLEALMAGRPVVAWGDPYYGRKGLTLDIADGAEIARELTAERLARPDPDKVAALVGHILEQGLVRHGDAAAFLQRVGEAAAVPPEPRLPWYGAPIRRLAAAGVALNRELSANRGMGAALRALPRADRATLEQRFGLRALRRHCWGAPRLEWTSALRRYLVARAFSTRLGQKVRFERVDLQAVHDPVRALCTLAAAARQSPLLVLLRQRPLSARLVQQVTGAEAVAWLQAQMPDLVADLFGWSGTRPLPVAAEGADALVLLRPPGARPLSPADREALTAG